VTRRSLSAIVVTGYTRRAVSVPQIHDLSYPALRLPRLPGKVIEIGDVKAGLVSLCILANKSCCIRKLVEEMEFRGVILLYEKLVRFGIESIPAPQKVDESSDIVLNSKCVCRARN
jgi:hypothetical protein